tara:strand:- start:82 stop:861 length:780 start_codon:yes stop_codon:yes gene_type:complete
MPTSDFTGIDFNYGKAFNSPREMGMGIEGDKFIDGNGNLGSNFTNVLKYGDALFVNNSAIKPGGLGNRYFIKTNKVCKNLDQTDSSRNRHVLLDNRGYSNVGIIPSLMNNISKLNPVTITKALIPENPLSSYDNDCVEVNVIEKLQNKNDNYNLQDYYSKNDSLKPVYMTKKNIRDVNPCFFDENTIGGNKTSKHQNPVTGVTGKNCDETFSSMNPPIEEEIVEENNYSKMPDDKLSQLYLSTITILGLYVLLKFIHKR